MVLCDTNILIEFYKANPSVIQTLQHIESTNILVGFDLIGEKIEHVGQGMIFAAANRELITHFEKKIQSTLARVWGEVGPDEGLS